jgi:GNAT superfamily N-acetyltransferase
MFTNYPLKMIIRPYNNSDWGSLCQIYDAARPIEVSGFMLASTVQSMSDVAEADGFFSSDCFVAELDGMLYGFVRIEPPELTWLYVSPKHHRRGVAMALFESVSSELGPDIWLTTAEENLGGVWFLHQYGLGSHCCLSR